MHVQYVARSILCCVQAKLLSNKTITNTWPDVGFKCHVILTFGQFVITHRLHTCITQVS